LAPAIHAPKEGFVLSGGKSTSLFLIPDPIAFQGAIVDGALVEHGRPRFEELTDEVLEHLRQYLRTLG